MSNDNPIRTAIITGSSGGIGRAIAERLASEGKTVGINGRKPEAVQTTVEAIRARGWQAFSAPGDVTREDDVRAMLGRAIETTGAIDILVNCAGGLDGINGSPNFEELTQDTWRQVVDRNLTSVFLCCRAAVPHMKKQGWGRIVNIASESGRVPIVPRSAGWAYAAAKSGILGLSRVLAADLAPFGITVNVVAPGFTRSGPRIEAYFNALAPEKQRARLSPTKLGRWAELPEIASAVAYVASEDASYMVGAVVDVNGGSYMP